MTVLVVSKPMMRVVINGKFYAGKLNGVHRVADRLIHELDAQLAKMPPAQRPDVSVILPRKARWRPHLSVVTISEESGRCGQFWEQFVLPSRARGAVLVNLCNLAPVLHPKKVLLVHDAQFLLPDSSYPWRQRVGYRILVPWMARSSACVLTVSNYSRQTLSALGVSPLHKTSVLHNGVDHILSVAPKANAAAGRPLGSEKYVLLFGSGKSYKNNRVIFDAFRDRRLADYKLVVIGPEEEELRKAGLEVASTNARFVGRIDDAELRALFDRAICLVFPSRTEGFGLPPAEAMLCGCPVVVAPAGAIPEVCRDAASYADVDDPASWIDAVLALDKDPVHRMAKIEAGRRQMARFRWDDAGKHLLEKVLALCV